MREIFQPIKEKELRRFHQAIDTVADTLLEEHQPKVIRFVKANLEVVDFLADDFFEIFQGPETRVNWDIFSSGWRWLWQKFPFSHLVQFILPMYKLDKDFSEKFQSFGQGQLELTHVAQKAFGEIDKYLKNFASGQELTEKYQQDDKELVRLYASLKTWENKEKFERFFGDFDKFLSQTVEVFIFGPLQLYLMISRESFLLIFKMWSVEKLRELEQAQTYKEIMAFHDFFHNWLEKFEPVKALREAALGVAKEYVRLLKQEEENGRSQLPTKELKKRFLERFEKGLLFGQEE